MHHMHPEGNHLPVRLGAQATYWLRNVWPVQTRLWSRDGEPRWIRARPAPEHFPPGLPTVRIAGSCQNTQPDGLYLRFGAQQNADGMGYADPVATGFVDVIAIEACGSVPNFNDKRSRYCPGTYAHTVSVPANWLVREIPTRGRGHIPIWRAAGIFDEQPNLDLYLPVRHLRVLYAIADHHWESVSCYVLNAHEFLFRHSQLGQYNAQAIRTFLRLMTPARNVF